MKKIKNVLLAFILMMSTLVSPLVMSSATYAVPGDITGLWNTGVDDSGNRLSQGDTDAHWQLVSVENPTNGDPHCQPSTYPMQATVTGPNIVTPDSAVVWPYDPADATWIASYNNTGQHTSSVSCPDPSDLSVGTNPASGGDTDPDTWPVFVYQMTDFTISESVNLDDVSIQTSMLADNYAEIMVNGTVISTIDGNVVGYASENPVVSTPVSGVFRHGANTLQVRVRSGYSNQGFVMSQLVGVSTRLASLSITKAASTDTMTVGSEEYFTLSVVNSGTLADNAATSGEIVVVDTIPDELTIGELPDGCTAEGQVVTCRSSMVLNPESDDELTFVIPVVANTTFEVTPSAVYVYGGDSYNCVDVSDCVASIDVMSVPAVPNTAKSLMQNPFFVLMITIFLATVTYLTTRKINFAKK